jgi:hypothetical protein
MTQRIFTDAFIRALKPATKPYKRSEHAPRGEGRLIVRVLPASAGSGGECIKEFFYRYRVNGLDKTVKLGRYGPSRTLADIRAACRERRNLQHETGDVKEHLRAEARRADAERRCG